MLRWVVNSWINKQYQIPQFLDSTFQEEFIEVWEQEFIQLWTARGTGSHALVVSNLPSVHLPWQPWCLTVITCQYAQNWYFNGELGIQKNISVTLVCVSIFHSANAMDVRERREGEGGWAGVGPEKNVRLWCSVTRQLSHQRPTVTWALTKWLCLTHVVHVIACILACDMLRFTCTYMGVIRTQPNLWPGTFCVYILMYSMCICEF